MAIRRTLAEFSDDIASADIADNAVTTAKIADSQITAAKVAADVATQAELDTVNTAVGLKATQAELNAVRQDMTILALREAVTENRVANNLPNSFIDQFQDDSGIGTETDTDRDVVGTVCEMWESMGSMVSEMDAEDHDQMFASVSHLPHLLAYASIQAIADSSTPEALSHSGAGLKDFSRIASSSPEMWADIFLENQENLLSRMNTFKDVVAKLEDAIKRNDKEKLIELLAQAKTERDRWMT